MAESTRSDAVPTLGLTVPAERVACFFPLLQRGVGVRVRLGIPVGVFLREGLGLSDATIEARIQTVFLDGRPVDDIEEALLCEGSTLALAPAMPGLMGAMLRRGGYYAPMRSGITHRGGTLPQGAGEGEGEGFIIVKLFGAALRELGPALLARGVAVDGGPLASLLESLPEDCRRGLGGRAALEGRERALLRVAVSGETGRGSKGANRPPRAGRRRPGRRRAGFRRRWRGCR